MTSKLFTPNQFLISAFTMLLLFLCSTSNVDAQSQIQTAAAEWNNVRVLTSEQRVIVITKTGEITKGFISQVTDDAIILIGKKQPVSVSRDAVRQIFLTKKSRTLGIALGVAGGVGALFASSYLAVATTRNLSENAAALIALPIIIGGTTGGAVLGSTIGSRYRKSRLIYQSN